MNDWLKDLLTRVRSTVVGVVGRLKGPTKAPAEEFAFEDQPPEEAEEQMPPPAEPEEEPLGPPPELDEESLPPPDLEELADETPSPTEEEAETPIPAEVEDELIPETPLSDEQPPAAAVLEEGEEDLIPPPEVEAEDATPAAAVPEEQPAAVEEPPADLMLPSEEVSLMPSAIELLADWDEESPPEDIILDFTVDPPHRNPIPPVAVADADGLAERTQTGGQDSIVIPPASQQPILLGSSLPDGTTHGQILWWDESATGWRVSRETEPSSNYVWTWDATLGDWKPGVVTCIA